MFIERIIYSILFNDIEMFKVHPDRFAQFILSGTKSIEESEKAKEYFILHPPTVIHGYPRTDSVFPCMCITLANENIVQDYLNEDGFNTDSDDNLYLDGDGNADDVHVRRWVHNFDVLVYADHPDICLYYYNLAKEILVRNKGLFLKSDYDNVSFSGADMAPDPRYSPEFLFVRRLGISMQSDWTYSSDDESFHQEYTVQGISVNDNEPLSSSLTDQDQTAIESLSMRVTTFSEEEDL